MIVIENISLTEQAAPVLRRQTKGFRPYEPGDVFGLVYTSSFTNADGTTVDGFRPGYSTYSVSPQGRSNVWALARPSGGPEFLFMSRFIWSADEHYVIDLASEKYELFSTGPVERPGRAKATGMTPREAFLKFASLCADNRVDAGMTDREKIDVVFHSKPLDKNLPALKTMFDNLLDEPYADGDLNELWRNLTAGAVWASGGYTRRFLQLARSRLRKKIR
jgi:hypothetical protein